MKQPEPKVIIVSLPMENYTMDPLITRRAG